MELEVEKCMKAGDIRFQRKEILILAGVGKSVNCII